MPRTESNDQKGYINHFNIHPNETVLIHLEGKVNDKALGEINNSAHVSYVLGGQTRNAHATDTYYPEPGMLVIDKTADKNTFLPRDTVNFNVRVSNQGKGWISRARILDDLNQITAEVIGDSRQPAFDDDTLMVTHDSDPGLVNILSDRNNQLEAIADIAPGASVNFRLAGKLKSGIVKSVTNTATAFHEGKQQDASVTIDEEKATVEINQVADKTVYAVGEAVTYTVILKNKNDAVADNIQFRDLIGSIKVMTADGTEKPAFSTWQIRLLPCPDNVVTHTQSGAVFTDSRDTDLDVNIDLSPQGVTTFLITGTVIPNAVGDITNTAQLHYDAKTISGNVTIKPDSLSYSMKKSNDQPHYKQGQLVSYTIQLKNTSRNVIYKKRLTDDMAAIQVDLMNGGRGRAFASGTVQLEPDRTFIPANAYVEPVKGDPGQWLVTLPPDG